MAGLANSIASIGWSTSEWNYSIRVAGIEREPLSWSLDRNVTGLPGEGQNSSHGAVGKVAFAWDSPILSEPPTPWTRADNSSWPPKAGQTVTIDLQRGDPDGTTKTTRIFTGIVDEVRGTSFHVYEIDLVDRIDQFTRRMKSPPIMHVMPPVVKGEALVYAGMHHVWMVNECFENSLFYAGIPWHTGTQLRGSMMGSLQPTVGRLASSDYPGGGWTWADFWKPTADWGMSLSWQSARYIPTPNIGNGVEDTYLDRAQTKPYILNFRVNSTNSGTYSYRFNRDTGAEMFRVEVAAGTRTVSIKDAAGTVVGSLDGSKVGKVVSVKLYPQYFSGSATIRSSVDGTTHESNFVFTAWPSSTHCHSVDWVGTFASTPGPWSISCNDDMIDTNWEPTAVIERSNFMTGLLAVPPIWNEEAGDILDEIAEATVSHWGIDELGRAWWKPNLIKTSDLKGSRLALSDSHSIYNSLDWASSWQGSASQVVANFLQPQVKVTQTAAITLWTSSGRELDPGEVDEQVISSPDNEDWIYVDGEAGTSRRHKPDNRLQNIINMTWVGWMAADKYRNTNVIANKEVVPATDPVTYTFAQDADYYAILLSLGGYDTWRLVIGNHGSKTISLGAPDSAELKKLRNKDFPVIRGQGKVVWNEESYSSLSTDNSAPVYALEAGKWMGGSGQLLVAELFNYLSGERVRLSEIEIEPQDNVRLGMPVDLTLTSLNVNLTGTITSYAFSATAEDGMVMTCDVQILASGVSDTTWHRLEEAAQGKTWADLEAKYTAAQNYNTFEAEPLRIGD